MKNIKQLVLLMLIILISSKSHSNTGFGISLETDEGKIFIPIDLSERYRLEPTFLYRMNDGIEGSLGSKSEYKEIGLGAISKNTISDEVRFNYGVRLSYISKKYEFASSSGDTSLDGYSVAPLVSFEYYPISKLSIGAEARLVYATLDGRETSFYSEEESKEKYMYTDTSLIIRFYW